MAFRGYAGWEGTSTAVAGLISAGYPCFMTEFGGGPWGSGIGGLDAEMTSELERLGVSWLTFQYIPPTGVSDDVTQPEHYQNIVNNAGLSWNPDYGNWPPARGPYGNGGQPRNTTTNWVNNYLTGTLHIEAEDFDTGGEGVAYHELTGINLGGQYRTNEAVDIETTTDIGGGYDVTGTAAGEWLEYTIWVQNPGYYNLALRYATPNNGCSVQAICNALDKTGTWTLPSTGGYTTWATATRQVFLEAGRQKLHLNILNGGFNLNWMELTPVSTGAIANGTYKFLNAANTLALTGVTSNGTVIPASYSGSTYQQWNLQHIGAGQYKITSANNGWSWTSFGGGLGFVWWWGVGGDQCYIIRPTGGGYYSVLTVGGGSALATSVTPTSIDQQTYSGAANQQWAIVSPSTPTFPIGLTVTASSSTQITLTWNAVAGATSYNVKRSATSGGPYTPLATGVTTTNYTDTVPAGATYYYVVSAVVNGVESPDSIQASLNLPLPWTSQDIGAVGVTGSAVYSNGVFTVTGSGDDIWNAGDAFRFVYVTATGNCTIIARVPSVQNIDSWSKAGVMIRESLNANSVNAFVAVTPGNGVTWQYRSSTGGNSSKNNNTTGLSAPYWVKLVRSGNTFTGYRSPDGTNWTQLGSATFTMASTAYVGLAVTAHNNSSLCTATFDNVTAPNWQTRASPVAPAGLAATAVSTSQINLVWNALTNAATYNVKRSLTDGGPYTPMASGVTATNYTDTGLTNGTTCYYVVSALNLAGESANSGQVSATPQAPPAISTLLTNANLALTWPLVNTGFTLQSSTNLASGNWVTVTSAVPQMTGGQWSVTLPLSTTAGAAFYRLVK